MKDVALLLVLALLVLVALVSGEDPHLVAPGWRSIPALFFVAVTSVLAATLLGSLPPGLGTRDFGPWARALLRARIRTIAVLLASTICGLYLCRADVTFAIPSILRVRGLLRPVISIQTPPRAAQLASTLRAAAVPYREAVLVAARRNGGRPTAERLSGDALTDAYLRASAGVLRRRLAAASGAEARREETRGFLLGTAAAIGPVSIDEELDAERRVIDWMLPRIETLDERRARAAVLGNPTIGGSRAAAVVFWIAAGRRAVDDALPPRPLPAEGPSGWGGGILGGRNGARGASPSDPAAGGDLFAALLLAVEEELDRIVGDIEARGRCGDWIGALGALPPETDPRTLADRFARADGGEAATELAEILRRSFGAGAAILPGDGTCCDDGESNGGGETTPAASGDTWPPIEAEILRIFREEHDEATHRRELLNAYRRAEGSTVEALGNRTNVTEAERRSFDRAEEIAAADGGPPLEERYRRYDGWDTLALIELYREWRYRR